MSVISTSPVGRTRWAVLAAVAGATALGWAALLAIGTTGLEALCGSSGFGLVAGTALMWGLMTATMMLPCAMHEIHDASRAGWRSATLFALSCIAPPTLLAIAVGTMLGQGAVATPVLLAIAGIALIAEAGWATAATSLSRLGSAIAMICLQLAGGAMDLAWMALVAVWMLALALAPARAALSQSSPARLLGLAAFGNF